MRKGFIIAFIIGFVIVPVVLFNFTPFYELLRLSDKAMILLPKSLIENLLGEASQTTTLSLLLLSVINGIIYGIVGLIIGKLIGLKKYWSYKILLLIVIILILMFILYHLYINVFIPPLKMDSF